MSRPRFLALLVLAVMWGGAAHALAEETAPPTPAKAPAESDCAEGTCEAPTEEPAPVEEEAAPLEEDAPAEEPADRTVEPVAPIADEPEAPEVDAPSAVASSANRAAMALADATVDVIDFDYSPGSVTVNTGDTVTWTQSGDEPHTVTADDGSFDSGEMATGETFSMRFDSPGTYAYYCTLHGGPGGEGMSAVVIVEGGDESEAPGVGNGDDNGNGNGNGNGQDPEEEVAGEDGALPRTGSGPPAAWVFALALVVTGYVLARVARMSERVARR